VSELATAELGLALLVLGVFLAFLPWASREDKRVRRLLYVLFVYFQLRYFYWRFSETLPAVEWQAKSVIAYAYLAFEIWIVLKARGEFALYRDFTNRSAEADAHMHWYSRRPRPPLVEYLIPTYNENYAVLERAIVTALAQDHARVRVWVLDDGRREWLRELARDKGAEYLTRPDNVGFKAGNLNHALRVIASLPEPGEFVAVLDCDFVAKPQFVRRALSLMYDETVAIVQTKQIYYNLDPFQYSLPNGRALPDWQRYAFDLMAPSFDVDHGQTCCGTCFLARRSSLELIGGIPTESVAEDALASFALNERGLKTIYLAEGLSFGIVAEGLREFLTQCGRWCLGRVQNIYTQWGALSPRKSLREKAEFVEGNVMWAAFSLSRVFQLWLPVLYWFSGFTLFPILGTNEGFLSTFLPVFVFTQVAETWLCRATVLPITGEARTLLWTEVVLRATFRGLVRSKNFKFDVTDKGATRDRVSIHWRPLKWLILTGGLTIAGLAYRATTDYLPSQSGGSFDAFAFFWSYYNLLTIAVAIGVCIEPPQRRNEERFLATEEAAIKLGATAYPGQLIDISMSGALIETAAPAARGDIVQIELEDVGTVAARVVRRKDDARVALEFRANSAEREHLIRKLFSDRYVRPILEGSIRRVYRGVLQKAFA
jgi:cellulose synthase (UDP-forming)